MAERNFLFVWVLVLLAIAAALVLSSCTKQETAEQKTTEQAAEETAPVEQSPAQIAGCMDSDGGDSSVKGKVTVGNTSYTDKCAEPFLVEYLCENGAVATQNFRCERGCDKGACE